MKRISLIGFMGAGKTTVAELLGRRLNFPVIEMDAEIVKLSGHQSPAEIFAREGEEYFRSLESKVAASLKNREPLVVSTGGGVISSQDNIASLREGGARVVYLHTSFETLLDRLKGDDERPLFRNKTKARVLYETREPIYRSSADSTIVTDGKSPEQIVDEIIKLM